MKNIPYLTILFLAVFSCHQNEGTHTDFKEEEKAISQSHGIIRGDLKNTYSTIPEKSQIRKVIWKANIEFQVSNVEVATENIKSIANKYHAFVSNMKLNSTRSRLSNKITLRVSSSNFDSLLNDIKGESIYIKSIEVNSKDVSEEFVDIESRLKTKKDVRDRYIEILRDKTGDVKDIIEAEEAIRKITEEIEAKEGRLRFLNDQVNFSTITLSLYQEVEYVKEPSTYVKPYFEKIYNGLQNGWSIVTNLIIVLVNIWPILLILGLLFWKRKWIISKFK